MPGASGILAHQAVARAAPDGYTLLFTNTSGLAINLVSFKQLPYDPTRDFAPVAMVCSLGPQMLSVNAELPVRSLPEFIAYAKANHGKLSMAFDTTAGAAAFAAKLLNKRTDLGLIEVPYRTAAQMTQDIASGTTQVMMSSIAAARSVVDAGKVRRDRRHLGDTFPEPARPAVRQRERAGRGDEWLVRGGRAGRHAARGRATAQSGYRRVSEGAGSPASGCWTSGSRPRAPGRPKAPPNSSVRSKPIGGLWPRIWISSRNEGCRPQIALSTRNRHRLLASAVRKVAKKNITRIVALGYFEMDFPRSRTIGRHCIVNSARGRRLRHRRTSDSRTAEDGCAAS